MEKSVAKRTSMKKLCKDERPHNRVKIDPSFKSKRYRDKLRSEVKSLEALLPVDRAALNRKIDSQTVFRLVLSFFRTKQFFQVLGFPEILSQSGHNAASLDDKEVLQILDGFLLLLSSDGTMLFASDNVLQYIGFNQVDLLHRCIYGIVHPDDHHDLKIALENTMSQSSLSDCTLTHDTVNDSEDGCALSFVCRMKYFNGSSAGYLKMHCSGKIRHQRNLLTNSRSSNNIVFLFVHPFMFNREELLCSEGKANTFWSKHEMDLKIREMDEKCKDILGMEAVELKGVSFYTLLHPEDLSTFTACHKLLTESTDVQTIYFRLETRDKRWKWFQSRGKVLSKNSKKFSIVFSHCPLSEDDSTFIQQETITRQKYSIHDLNQKVISGEYKKIWRTDRRNANSNIDVTSCSQQDDLLLSLQSSICPSSWHILSDRHSPVLPSNHVSHKLMQQEKQRQFLELKRNQRAESKFILDDRCVNTVDVNFSRSPEYLYAAVNTQSYLPDVPYYTRQVRYQPEISASVMSSALVFLPSHAVRKHYNYNIHPGSPDIYNVSADIQANVMFQPGNLQSSHVLPVSNIQIPVEGNTSLPGYQFSVSSNYGQFFATYEDVYSLPPPSYVTRQLSNPQTIPTPSCAAGTDVAVPEMSKSNMEDTAHMKIVEVLPIEETPRQVDLPSIGSFLEYLNEV